MYEYESELLGESCELGTPWKGCALLQSLKIMERNCLYK